MNYQERLDRLQLAIQENRVIRKEWQDRDAQGRKLMCLLVALSPEVGEKATARACPASVMPQWLAMLTPSMDDGGSLAEWQAFIRRYAAAAARWHVLTPEAWQKADHAVRATAVREAMTHTSNPRVLEVCEKSAALNERAAQGHSVSKQEWINVSETAEALMFEVETEVYLAVRVSSTPLEEKKMQQAMGDRAASLSALKATAPCFSVVAALRAALHASDAATGLAAQEAAWDRMNDKILTILENACHAVGQD